MQNINPSAPPDEVEDDYQWIENAVNNDNKPNDNQEQGFIQPQGMAIPDAITQQLIYQKIMEEQKKKKVEENEEKQPIPSAPQIPHDQYQVQGQQPQQPVYPVLAQPQQQQQSQQPQQQQQGAKPSYMAQDIQYPETALYKAAGLCVWRQKENGKGIQIMMGLEKTNNTLSFFGGKRDDMDKTCVDTAIREFHEETGKKLDEETLSQVLCGKFHSKNSIKICSYYALQIIIDAHFRQITYFVI